MSRNTEGTAIEPGIIARVVNGVKGFVRGVSNADWMTPGQPVEAQEPEAQRNWDYPVGVNLRYTPRSENVDNISFAQLRSLADGYDLMRLVIETRKDQVAALNFSFVDKSSGKETTESKKIRDSFIILTMRTLGLTG
jgi:hypothetical protein